MITNIEPRIIHIGIRKLLSLSLQKVMKINEYYEANKLYYNDRII